MGDVEEFAPEAYETDPRELGRAAWTECLATMLYVFISAGTVEATRDPLGTGGAQAVTSQRVLSIALANGLGYALLVHSTARISGGHLNPAITLSCLVTRKMAPVRALVYFVAQIVGGILGALIVLLALPEELEGYMGATRLGENVNEGNGFFMEFILTFLLVLNVFATGLDPKGMDEVAPLSIGLGIVASTVVGALVSGASMNPARSFGPAVVDRSFKGYHWIYWIGPLTGGPCAALLYEYVFLSDSSSSLDDL